MLDTQDAARRLRRCRRLRGGFLDCRCARRSAVGQVGTKGWSCPIEQRDVAIGLSPTSPATMTNLLNLTHTTFDRASDAIQFEVPRIRHDDAFTDRHLRSLRCPSLRLWAPTAA